MPKSKGKSKGGGMVPGRRAVGNQIVTNRGYGGGKQMKELIGAKKVSGPKGAK